jgi:TonB family protein
MLNLATLAFLLYSTATFHAHQGVAPPWPPPGVLTAADVDQPAHAVTRPGPDYPADAMRAGITGTVVVQCVVNADGSVGDTRVARSVDALHGLDQAAVDAVKKWRYTPALKAGRPVPMAVTVEVGFSLPEDTASGLAWPAALAVPPSGAGAWNATDIDANSISLHVEYPEGWTLRRGTDAQAVATLQTQTSDAAVAITTSPTSERWSTRPLAPDDLEAVAARIAGGADAGASGQVSAGGRLWVWVQSPSPGGGTTWTFRTAVDEVAVTSRMTSRGADAARAAELAAEIGSLLRRLKLTPKP